MGDSEREVIAVKTEIKEELEDMDEGEIYMEDSYWKKCAMDIDPLCGSECSPCTEVKTEMDNEREHGDNPEHEQDSKTSAVSYEKIPLQENSEELNSGVSIKKSLSRHNFLPLGPYTSKAQGQTVSTAFLHNKSSHPIKNKHLNIKSYKCGECNKIFSKEFNLIRHKRIHTGDKPYKCEYCNKSFTVSSTLVTHRRTHTGEKPYNCDVCKKSFIDGSTLISHRRIHTGDRPYKCDRCDKSFSHCGNLKRHKQSHEKA